MHQLHNDFLLLSKCETICQRLNEGLLFIILESYYSQSYCTATQIWNLLTVFLHLYYHLYVCKIENVFSSTVWFDLCICHFYYFSCISFMLGLTRVLTLPNLVGFGLWTEKSTNATLIIGFRRSSLHFCWEIANYCAINSWTNDFRHNLLRVWGNFWIGKLIKINKKMNNHWSLISIFIY